MRKKVWAPVLAALAVFGLIGFLIVQKAFREAHVSVTRSVCIGNLRYISSYKAEWANENGADPATTPTFENLRETGADFDRIFCGLISPDLRSHPSNSYNMNAVSNKPTCKMGEHQGHSLSYIGR